MAVVMHYFRCVANKQIAIITLVGRSSSYCEFQRMATLSLINCKKKRLIIIMALLPKNIIDRYWHTVINTIQVRILIIINAVFLPSLGSEFSLTFFSSNVLQSKRQNVWFHRLGMMCKSYQRQHETI